MKLDERIAGHVGDTTLDPALVKGFLQMSPHYRQWGVNRRLDSHSLAQLNATDLFAFYMRFYVTGRHKTLQAVLREVRIFAREDAQAAHYLIVYSMEDTRQQLLTLEWYELIPRLELARERVLALVPNLANHIRPRVIRYLEAS